MRTNFLFCVLLILCSCSNKNKVKIEGKIDNLGLESKIYLYEQQVTDSKLEDSSQLSSHGEFKFKIKLNDPRFYLLRVGNTGIINLLLSPGENLFVNADLSHLKSSISVKGSIGSKLILDLVQKHDSVLVHLDSLRAQYNRIKDLPSSKDQMTVLGNDFNNSKTMERKNTIRFIIENFRSMASIMALYLKYDSSEYVLEYPKDLQYYKIVSDTLSKIYPTSKHVKALKLDLEKMLKIQKSQVLKSMIKNAKVSIPEISLPNAKGDTIRITSLMGKIILLSFWSSESKDCLMLNRDYLNLYKKFGKSGLVIYQVSVDRDKNKWLAAIKEIPWISVYDINSDKSYYAGLYNISQIPASFLIDQKASFIGKNLTAKELDRSISGLLKK
jgi:peroxiredoxin